MRYAHAKHMANRAALCRTLRRGAASLHDPGEVCFRALWSSGVMSELNHSSLLMRRRGWCTPRSRLHKCDDARRSSHRWAWSSTPTERIFVNMRSQAAPEQIDRSSLQNTSDQLSFTQEIGHLNHRQTVQAVARRLPHLKRHTVAEVLEVTAEVWADELAQPGSSVTLMDLGKLYVEAQQMRVGGAVRDRIEAEHGSVPTRLQRLYYRFRPSGWLRQKIEEAQKAGHEQTQEE